MSGVSGSAAAMLEVEDAVLDYANVRALDHVSLSAARGEFLTLLGESGSGKTTMLRVISGLARPTSIAKLAIDGEDVRAMRPAQRRCTTVFQSYALFPHMSVIENVAYGLKVRGFSPGDAKAEALRALAMVRLESKAERRISQLSGGEKQRVALARAVVTKPAILLLDEPLGALDEKLRLDMQSELVDIQRSLGITFIYITHSQEEALTMSDRIVLMRRGRIEQTGRPVDLFDRPVNRFTAEFMGFENLLPGRVLGVEKDGLVRFELAGGIAVDGIATGPTALVAGQQGFAAIRAERLRPVSAQQGANTLACRPSEQIYRGKYVDQSADTVAGRIKLRRWDRTDATEAVAAVAWQKDDCVIISS